MPCLEYFSALTDLPKILLVGMTEQSRWNDYFDLFSGIFIVRPYVTWVYVPDWEHISKTVHGLSPDIQWVTQDGAMTSGLLTGKWPKHEVNNNFSEYSKYMQELDMVIHPYFLQTDMRQYRKTGYEETRMYVNRGVDGIFAEQPTECYQWFEELGL